MRGYIDERGHKRFADWLDGLDAVAAAKATIALARLEKGNFRMSRVWGLAFLNTRLNSGRATASTLARTESAS